MNRITFVGRWVNAHLFAFVDSRRNDRISDNLRIALNIGTTITTRFWISLFSIVMGLQLHLGQPSMFSYAGYQTFFVSVPAVWWSSSMIGAGLLMFWRAATPNGRPVWGAISNLVSTLLWGTIAMSRVVVDGPIGLLSSATVLWIMCSWCLVRTGATRRDMETA